MGCSAPATFPSGECGSKLHCRGGRAASGPTGARGGRAMASRGTDAGAVGMHDASLSLSRLLEPEVRRDAYPFYCLLRGAAPVHWGESSAGGRGALVVNRNGDVMAIFRRPHMFAVRRGPPPGGDWLPLG